ncbi:MAG: hypothetical protein HN475_03155 [Piscirickettsiaceae bacterium]|jgi:hypothetical protein|nr:hypothetical protein [Piscirickettsiaceae bacterium]
MRKFLLSMSILFPSIALAHEAHGQTLMENLWHVLASPEHAWPLTIALAITVVVVCINSRR